jgi:hypothetical protein
MMPTFPSLGGAFFIGDRVYRHGYMRARESRMSKPVADAEIIRNDGPLTPGLSQFSPAEIAAVENCSIYWTVT